MSADFDTPLPRDRWSRPLVAPPGGGKLVPYTRCTTYVGVLEDTYNLAKWQMRQVALGLADRPDLALSVAAHRHDKKELDNITDQALAAAKSKAAATTGTALHALTEQHDLGQTLGTIPTDARNDIDAYIATTQHLEYVGVEQFRVNDHLKIGGTCDRLIQHGGHYYIGDIKTGSIEFGIGKIAMQLAVYAHSTPYDHRTQTRNPDPVPLDLQRGLIIHLPAGQAHCELVWVDIAAGWEAVQVATQVRAWRARKALATPATDLAGGATTSDPLLEQVLAFTDVDELRSWYIHLPPGEQADVLPLCQTRAEQLLEAAAKAST